MLLMRLRAVVRERREVPLGELARVLETAPDVLETMLDHWIARGCIQKRESPCSGKSCSCSYARDPVYVWVEPSASRPGKAPARAGHHSRAPCG